MEPILLQFTSLGAVLNPPATGAQLGDLETAAACTLPEELRSLYRQADGMSEAGTLPLRWMPLDEVRRDLDVLREAEMTTEEIRALWTDDQGNYAAVYVDGSLRGRICFLDHEEVDPTPAYADLAAFREALLQAARAGQGWYEMLQARPAPPALSPQDEKELALALDYLEQAGAAKDAKKRCKLLFKAMELFPASETHRIQPFLQDDDMWVQERACRLLGKRRYVPAIPAIADVARRGKHNGKIGAMVALREWDHPEAAAQCAQLLEEIDPNWAIYLRCG